MKILMDDPEDETCLNLLSMWLNKSEYNLDISRENIWFSLFKYKQSADGGSRKNYYIESGEMYQVNLISI